MPNKKRRAGTPPGRATVVEDLVIPELPPDAVPEGEQVNGVVHEAVEMESAPMPDPAPTGVSPDALFHEAQLSTARFETLESMRNARLKWMADVRPTYEQYEREADALGLAMQLAGQHIEAIGRLARAGVTP